MLGWAILFLIVAIVAAVIGFGTVAGIAATIAKILFVLFLILFIISLFTGRRGVLHSLTDDSTAPSEPGKPGGRCSPGFMKYAPRAPSSWIGSKDLNPARSSS